MKSCNKSVTDVFARVFEQIDDCKERLTKVEVYEEVEQKKIDEISAKLDDVTVTLNQIIGKEAIRSSIAGVIGAIIAGVVTWIFSLIKGG